MRGCGLPGHQGFPRESNSYDVVSRVYDAAGNVIETLHRNSVYGNVALDANFIEKDHGRSSQIDYWNQRLGDGEVTRLLDLHHLQR